jgi:hypothetical protein
MPEELDKSFEKDLKKHEDSTYDSLIKQIDAEYNLSWLHQYDKIQQTLSRMKLYNNQRKDPNTVGDPLLFTVHQTVLASLYDDRLMATWEGHEEGDEETAENLNGLTRFDYDKMEKDVLDYMWDWDTLFFSRGLVSLMEFDRSKEYMCPVPEIFDPGTFLRDPRAISVNGDMRRRGGMRFGGRELWFNKVLMTDKNGYFNTSYLRTDNEIKDLIYKAQEARDSAQNLQAIFSKNMEANLGDNATVGGLQWFTHWKGKRVVVELVKKRTRIVKYTELDDQTRFPIIDRPMYPHSHSWDNTSIPDLTEDKQRQRSVAINLGLQAMKSDMYPMYIYDEDRIKNKGDLLKFGFNKFVGIQNNEGKDIRTAVAPLNKANPSLQMANFILETLDASAQRATATPDMQQGQIENQRRTLGELNLVASKVDTRFSLSAKVFGWSERAFWRMWYGLYKEHFHADIDKKIIRIKGSLGNKWRPLLRDNIVAKTYDPDVFIDSQTVSEAKMVRERILFQAFGQALFSDPDANRRFYLKKLAKLNGLSKDDIMLLLPPTVDELLAEDENNKLNKNQLVQVSPNDKHMIHLEIHAKAAETAAKAAHIAAHKYAMKVQRDQPELFPELQAQQLQQQDRKTPSITPNLGNLGGLLNAPAGNMQGGNPLAN